MGILFTSPTGGNVVSAADFAMPATNKVAIDVCFAPVLGQVANMAIVCDQPNQTPTLQQKIMFRINGSAGGNNDKISFTWVDDAGVTYHYYSTYALTSTSAQTAHVELDLADATTVRMAYYSASAPGDGFVIEDVTEVMASTPGAVNANSNPIVDGANEVGGLPFFGTLYWRAIRDQWAGDSAVNAMLGKTTPGVLRHTLQYSTGHIRHYREFNSGETTDPFTGDVATITGGSFVSDPSGVEPMAVLAVQPDATVGKDCYTNSGTDVNFGVATTMLVGSTAANATRHAFWEFDLIALGFPADAVFSSFILRLECTTAAATTRAFTFHRVAAAWTEGTSNGASSGDGVSHTNRIAESALTWTTPGGDFTTPTVAGGNLPTSTGTFDYDIADLANDAMQNRSGILSIAAKRDVENDSTAAVATFSSSDHATAGNRPEIIGTYEVTSEFLTAEINSDGESFALAFQTLAWDTAAFNGDATDIEFTVTRDGSPVVITGTGTPTIAVAGQTLIEGDLDGVIYSGETVTVSFPAGLILDADGRTCEGGTNEAVTNGSAEAAPAAGGPDLTLGGAASCASNSR